MSAAKRPQLGLSRLAAPALPLAVAIVAGGFLRLWAIGRVGYNSDEAVYAGQGAAMLGDEALAQHFSLFRAHPLLLQLVVGVVFRVAGVDDELGRIVVAAVFGVGSVVFTYLLGARLYGRRVGCSAALVVAVLPYHVVVSRQVMVDTPMGFFVTGSMWLSARYVTGARPRNLVGAFVMLGAGVLSKEVAILGVIPLGLTLLHHRGWGVLRERALWVGGALLLLVVAPFPASRLIHQPENAGQFFLFQILRRPNHSWDYFGRVLLQFGGPVLLVLLGAGLLRITWQRRSGEMVILPWLVTFGLFFVFWPTKLFPYLYPLLPAMAIAAVVGLEAVVRTLAARRRTTPKAILVPALVGAWCCSLAYASWSIVAGGPEAQVPGATHFDIEVQTFAGGREVGDWAGEATPSNAKFLTIGPSIGNVIRFYGHRESVALSVSGDPRRRNPAYVPVPNPDAAIRGMDVQYAVWDAYSADRSAFYNGRLMRYVRKYGGVPVYSAFVDGGTLHTVAGPPPADAVDVRVKVFSLQGGDPSQGDRFVDDEGAEAASAAR